MYITTPLRLFDTLNMLNWCVLIINFIEQINVKKTFIYKTFQFIFKNKNVNIVQNKTSISYKIACQLASSYLMIYILRIFLIKMN